MDNFSSIGGGRYSSTGGGGFSTIGGGSTFSVKNMLTALSAPSAYAAFMGSVFLINSVIREVKSVAYQVIPLRYQNLIISKLESLFWKKQSPINIMTLVVDQYNSDTSMTKNELYDASQNYLRTKITPSLARRLKVSKSQEDKNLVLTISPNQTIIEEFEGVKLTWDITYDTSNMNSHSASSSSQNQAPKRIITLSFEKENMETVVNSYLSHVMETSTALKQEDKVLKLYGLGCGGMSNDGYYQSGGGGWGSMDLDHPSTFETLAMEPSLKMTIMEDLDRFVKRRNFYRRVGKAWKRGYLLYGPPGTGKSSLIAAIANYLNFSIYDLQLSSIFSDKELRRVLVSTSNRSILVIEDIDCGNLPDRKNQDFDGEMRNHTKQVKTKSNKSGLTLSGLLNFIDGLWPSCGDERIIIFTTNHKDRLDPAMLRPGRMDVHIHMSYCTPGGFRTLLSNYLDITTHDLLPEINELIEEVDVTPAEIAEELMKSEDADIALQGLRKFLQTKKSEVGDKRRASTVDNDEDENIVNKKIRQA